MHEQAAPASATILPFRRPGQDLARLSMRDRMDVTIWQESAPRYGYDRLVIHERSSYDAEDVESFLSIYRRGETWSRWGVARRGNSVLAWCAYSGMDVGEFGTVDEALGNLFGAGSAVMRQGVVVQAFSAAL